MTSIASYYDDDDLSSPCTLTRSTLCMIYHHHCYYDPLHLFNLSSILTIYLHPYFSSCPTGQYAAAGGLATETLGAVRTVTALNAQPAVINQYRRFLFDAMRVGTY